MTNAIQSVAEDITMLATLRRIKRKADIMVMDSPKETLARQNAIELQLLAGIALRCIVAKTHPCMVPFDQLPEWQQKKDKLFLAIVRALA